MTDHIATIDGVDYYADGTLGEAKMARAKNGRRIAIHWDPGTMSAWACSSKHWRRYYNGMSYGAWRAKDSGIPVYLDENGVYVRGHQ